jgi:hypothetical protein
MAKINKATPGTVNKAAEQSLQAVEMKRRALLKTYKTEKTVPVSISPLYKPYFGASMAIGVNGISTYVPCDGKTYHLPKTFATEAKRKIMMIDLMIDRKKRLNDVSSNAESTPGEIKFF